MPYADSWLELEKSLGGRFTMIGTAEELRAQYTQLQEMLRAQLPPPSDAVDTKDGEVDGIKCRLYTPKEASKQGPLPVTLWLHGGGWVTGDIDGDDLQCREVAEAVPSIVINVDYRLAPEHKIPTGLQDTLTVLNWAHRNATSFGGNPKKLYVTGGSAGAALALQVANRIAADPTKRGTVKGVAAVVPVTLHYDNVPEEFKSIYKAYQDNEKGEAVLDIDSMKNFFAVAGVEDPKDSDFFTALATANHKNFPPTYFASCEYDILRDDAYVMEAALKKAGVPTKHDHYKGFPHYFWIFPSIPESKQFVENLINGLKWLVAQTQDD